MSETPTEAPVEETEGTTLPEAPEAPAETPAEAPAETVPAPEAPEVPEAPAETPTEAPAAPAETEPAAFTASADDSLEDEPRHGHRNFDREPPVSPPGIITSSAGEIAAQAEGDGNASAYKEAVKDGVDPQLATHLATVPTVATTTGGDGIQRIVNTNVDKDWVPAPVESDPKERERLEKASALLEERMDGSALLER